MFVFLSSSCFKVKHELYINYITVISNCRPDRYVVSFLLIRIAILYLWICLYSPVLRCSQTQNRCLAYLHKVHKELHRIFFCWVTWPKKVTSDFKCKSLHIDPSAIFQELLRLLQEKQCKSLRGKHPISCHLVY